MESLFSLVLKWASDRNLIDGSKPKDQYTKLMSEFGEFCNGIVKSNHEEILDGCGDTLVVLAIIAKQYGFIALDEMVPELRPGSCFAGETRTLCVASHLGIFGDYIAKNQTANIQHAIPQIITELAYAANAVGVDAREGLRSAYESIKDRKGVMFNGVFVKDSDPRYAGILQELQAAQEV